MVLDKFAQDEYRNSDSQARSSYVYIRASCHEASKERPISSSIPTPETLPVDIELESEGDLSTKKPINLT